MIPLYLWPLSPLADIFKSPQEIFIWLPGFFFLTILRTKNNCAPRLKEQWHFCLFFFKSELLFRLCAFIAFLILFQSFLLCKTFVAGWCIEITDCKYIWSFIYLVWTGWDIIFLQLSDETHQLSTAF